MYIEIVNEEPTMKMLLQRLSECPYTIRKVERQTASLEEIFMKVAKRHERIQCTSAKGI